MSTRSATVSTRRAAILGVALSLVAGALLLAAPADAVVPVPADQSRRCAWPVVYPGEANYAWPDTNASYINQAVLIGASEKVVITGTDPKARYWSITTYNFADREVIDRVNDVTVKRKGTGPRATWTVTVSPKDNPKDPNSLKSAAPYVTGDPLQLEKITVIMYRVYLPERGGYTGGPLPTVTLHHDDGFTKKAEKLPACKGDQIGEPPDKPDLEPATDVPEYFERAEGGRFYPSYDTSYLAAQVPFDPDRILLVTGKAPRVPKDVRYWSLCQNINEGLLPVVDCASDKDVALRNGRYSIAVVAPGQVPDRTQYPGVTFVEWGEPGVDGNYLPAFLIMRNILPSKAFKQSIANVPVGEPATSTMGPYAPIIRHVTLEELAAL